VKDEDAVTEGFGNVVEAVFEHDFGEEGDVTRKLKTEEEERDNEMYNTNGRKREEGERGSKWRRD
jgi:hemerythrin superfamily protein